MKQVKKSFRHESLQDTQTLQNILNAVTKGLAKGHLTFSDEEDEIVFHPEGLMRLKLSASQDGNRQSFNLKVSWELEEGKKKNKTLKVNKER